MGRVSHEDSAFEGQTYPAAVSQPASIAQAEGRHAMSQGTRSRLQCSILGPLDLRVDGVPVRVGAAKERLLLAVLLCHANRAVSSAQLVDALWGTTPPRTARKNLQVYLSALRKKLGDRIRFHGWGYSLHAVAGELDMLTLRKLAGKGRRAVRDGDARTAATLLGKAIRLWRDEPLVEFSDVSMIAETARRITNFYLSVYEDWVELEIDLGRPIDALHGLDDLVAHYPTRERIVAARMTALVRCGRPSEALAQFDTLRRHLASELGVDPSPAVRSLYHEILEGRAPASGRTWRSEVRWTDPARRPGNQLPRDIVDFVGRAAETARILQEDAAVTVITGEPGAGKTTLAVRVAHRLAGAFDDGALMVPFRRCNGQPANPSDIQRELLEAVGIRVAAIREDTIVGALWRSWISDQRLLFILDDVANELSVRMFLPGNTSSRVLVTSRRQLSGLESVVRVRLGELSENEATTFLHELLGEARVTASQTAVAAILRRYGRLPMPLRVIGQRFATVPHVPLAELVDRLGSSQEPLDELAAGDMSVKSRYEQWYADLPPEQRETLITLGALDRAQFSHDELLALLQDDPVETHRAVERAFESNMATIAHDAVAAGPSHYSMSPSMHRFAAECRAAMRDQGGPP